VTREQKAAVLIGDGERIAIDPILRRELPFEVGRPQIVRRGRDRRDHAGMDVWPPAASLGDQTLAHQQIARGAGRGPRDPWMPADAVCRFSEGALRALQELRLWRMLNVRRHRGSTSRMGLVPLEPDGERLVAYLVRRTPWDS
jgi:hypothetical protein